MKLRLSLLALFTLASAGNAAEKLSGSDIKFAFLAPMLRLQGNLSELRANGMNDELRPDFAMYEHYCRRNRIVVPPLGIDVSLQEASALMNREAPNSAAAEFTPTRRKNACIATYLATVGFPTDRAAQAVAALDPHDPQLAAKLNALKGTANGLHKALQDFPIETLGMPQLAQDARRDLDKLSRGIDSIASALQSDLAAERRAATAGPAAVAAPDNAGAPWKLVKQYEGGFADFGFAANHTIHLVRCRNGTEHKLYRDAKGKWGSLGLGGNNSAPSFELAAGQKCG